MAIYNQETFFNNSPNRFESKYMPRECKFFNFLFSRVKNYALILYILNAKYQNCCRDYGCLKYYQIRIGFLIDETFKMYRMANFEISKIPFYVKIITTTTIKLIDTRPIIFVHLLFSMFSYIIISCRSNFVTFQGE